MDNLFIGVLIAFGTNLVTAVWYFVKYHELKHENAKLRIAIDHTTTSCIDEMKRLCQKI